MLWFCLLLSGHLLVFTDQATATDRAPQEESKQFIQAYVFHCQDGDTCRVKVADSIWFNIRLAGIDAPETAKQRSKRPAQAFGEEAKEWLNHMIKGQVVHLRQVDLDHYNRPIVEVMLAESNINLGLLQEGLAEVYSGKTKRLEKKLYIDAEAKAKVKKKGIWSLEVYQSPKDFRQNKPPAPLAK